VTKPVFFSEQLGLLHIEEESLVISLCNNKISTIIRSLRHIAPPLPSFYPGIDEKLVENGSHYPSTTAVLSAMEQPPT